MFGYFRFWSHSYLAVDTVLSQAWKINCKQTPWILFILFACMMCGVPIPSVYGHKHSQPKSLLIEIYICVCINLIEICTTTLLIYQRVQRTHSAFRTYINASQESPMLFKIFCKGGCSGSELVECTAITFIKYIHASIKCDRTCRMNCAISINLYKSDCCWVNYTQDTGWYYIKVKRRVECKRFVWYAIDMEWVIKVFEFSLTKINNAFFPIDLTSII